MLNSWFLKSVCPVFLILGAAVPALAANNFEVKNDASSYLFVDGATGNVGIGSAVPQARLDVEGAVYFGNGNVGINTVATRGMLDVEGTVYMAGNVGIGTNLPQEKLHVDGGNIRLGRGRGLETVDSSGTIIPLIYTPAGGNNAYLVDANINTYYIGPTNARITGRPETGYQYLSFTTNNLERMRIVSTGNVGIGTTEPFAKLQVDGNFYIPAGRGNIGIGTWLPRTELEVDGGIYGTNIGVGTTMPQALLEVGTATNIISGSSPAMAVKNDVVVDGNVYATEFHLGADAVVQYNATMTSIDFIIY